MGIPPTLADGMPIWRVAAMLGVATAEEEEAARDRAREEAGLPPVERHRDGPLPGTAAAIAARMRGEEVEPRAPDPTDVLALTELVRRG